MKKFIIKATTLAGVGTLLVTGALPVNAEDTTSDGTTKDESVYVVLNADGSVSSVTVSDQLHNANGFSNYQDKSDLKDVQNLKSDDPVQSSSDGYKWTTTDTDIYYQGKTTKALPLDTTIEYKLDGKTVDPKDIVGKSGHLSMTFNIKNTQTKQYTIDGKTYTVCQPFYVAAGGMLDQDHFTNVKIDHGTVSTDTSHSIALAVMMPGMKDSIGQFLTGDLSSLNDYLFDTVTIEADVTDFESPTMMMAASTDLSALKGELKDDGAFDTTDLFDQLDELDAATQKLIDGSKTLYEGADQLKDGANQVNDGVGTLVNGTSTLTDGTSQLAEGASSALAGATALQAGLGQLSSNNATLNSGMSQVADAILATVNKELDANATIKNDSKYESLTWENYGTQLGYYAGISDGMRQVAFNQIKEQLKNNKVNVTDDQLNMLLYMAAVNHQTDLTSYLVSQQGNLAIAQHVQDVQNDQAVKVATGKDYSSADRFLNLATYEGAVGSVQKKVAELTKASGQQISLTSRQAEEVISIAVKNKVTDLSNVDYATIAPIVSSVLNKVDGNADALGVDGVTWVAPLRAAQTDNVVYTAAKAMLTAGPYNKTEAEVAMLASYGSMYYANSASISEMAGYVSNDAAIAKTIQSYLVNSQSDTGKQAIISYLNGVVSSDATASAAIEEIKNAKQSLDSVAFLKESLKQYTDGVSTAYAGSQSLTDGLQKLSSGASQVSDGAAQLSQGAKTLKDGTQTLSDGATQLSDGAKTLYDGLVQYNEEGISKLTENSDLDNLQTASKLISDIQNDDDAYVNYSGISDGTDGTVKFIYKISTVKSEADTEKDAASKSDDTSDVQESSDKGNFFTRLADLFIFWN
jgi:putative membrane protein